jgi:hypothetical protein
MRRHPTSAPRAGVKAVCQPRRRSAAAGAWWFDSPGRQAGSIAATAIGAVGYNTGDERGALGCLRAFLRRRGPGYPLDGPRPPPIMRQVPMPSEREMWPRSTRRLAHLRIG